MQDTFKSFLVALVTSVAVLFVLGPVMMKVHGLQPTAAQPAGEAQPAAPGAGTAAPAPAPQTQMTAPNIEGMLAKDARDRFRAQGITIIEESERVDASAEPGAILEQIPSGGAPLVQKEIRVIVAKAPELLAVPNIVGESLDEARNELVTAGFEVPEAEYEMSDEPGGTVIRQEPNAGAKTEQGALVRLFVAAELVAVPKIRGKRIGAAKTAITEAGLTVGRVTQREDEELSGGRVIGQKPGAGEKVAPGTAVDIVMVAPD
jgi:serine/threonine-protein kinase